MLFRSYKYYDEDGKRASGWRTIEGVENISEDGEYFRFYFKNGAPYYGKEDLESFTIDSKKYAFNTAGEMQTGKQSIRLSDGTAANYYFDEEGIMKTGKQTIYEVLVVLVDLVALAVLAAGFLAAAFLAAAFLAGAFSSAGASAA